MTYNEKTQSLFDYVIWRCDLSFDQDAFRDADSLILCCLAYLRLDPLFEKQAEWTLTDVAAAFFALPIEKRCARTDKDWLLLKQLAHTRRYGELRLSDYMSVFDETTQEQFAALRFTYRDEWTCCVFRGTDNTLIGWKEDFNMTFMEVIPAQKRALDYVQSIVTRCPYDLYLAGHSKGGNLAVYAAAHLDGEVQKRILTVYNHDGPGFMKEATAMPAYQAIVNRIKTYVPQSSIVGILLEHEESYHVVHSSQVSLWQHDPYSWCMDGPRFSLLETRSAGSYFMDDTIRKWIEHLPIKQRAAFVDAVFEVLQATKVVSLKEMNANRMHNIAIILKAVSCLDDEERKMMAETILSLLDSACRTAKDMWNEPENSDNHLSQEHLGSSELK